MTVHVATGHYFIGSVTATGKTLIRAVAETPEAALKKRQQLDKRLRVYQQINGMLEDRTALIERAVKASEGLEASDNSPLGEPNQTPTTEMIQHD